MATANYGNILKAMNQYINAKLRQRQNKARQNKIRNCEYIFFKHNIYIIFLIHKAYVTLYLYMLFLGVFNRQQKSVLITIFYQYK